MTKIVPRAAPAVEQVYDVDHPRFGRAECRDVVFDEPVPSLYNIGNQVRLDVRVVVGDRNYSQVLLRFWKVGGTSEQALNLCDALSASGASS